MSVTKYWNRSPSKPSAIEGGGTITLHSIPVQVDYVVPTIIQVEYQGD